MSTIHKKIMSEGVGRKKKSGQKKGEKSNSSQLLPYYVSKHIHKPKIYYVRFIYIISMRTPNRTQTEANRARIESKHNTLSTKQTEKQYLVDKVIIFVRLFVAFLLQIAAFLSFGKMQCIRRMGRRSQIILYMIRNLVLKCSSHIVWVCNSLLIICRLRCIQRMVERIRIYHKRRLIRFLLLFLIFIRNRRQCIGHRIFILFVIELIFQFFLRYERVSISVHPLPLIFISLLPGL
mmetsp:Transcript_15364/g.24195  ORF Transcript_15364/g.24195 Transcript_15364/m.24195 type:complete len:235 (+) Transcript_15364:290-994(+)